MVDRRKFLRSAGATGVAALLAGCTGGDGSSGDGGDGSPDGGSGGDDSDMDNSDNGTTTESMDTEVEFVLTPAESDIDVKAQYQGMFDYLESETDATINARVAADYAAVYQAFQSDRGDVADASPTLAVVGGNEGITDIVGIRVAFGAAKYFSLITTTQDSGIEELADLEGETVAFADRLSTSGSLFPLVALKRAGLDIGNAPDGNPADFEGQWSDHTNARDIMINRDEIAAAGTGAFSTIAHVPSEQLPQRVKDIAPGAADAGSADPPLDLVHASDPIPRAPILSRSSWDAPVRDQIETAMVEASPDDLKGGNAEEEIWFTGLVEGSLEDYRPVEEVKNELGLEFGN